MYPAFGEVGKVRNKSLRGGEKEEEAGWSSLGNRRKFKIKREKCGKIHFC